MKKTEPIKVPWWFVILIYLVVLITAIVLTFGGILYGN